MAFLPMRMDSLVAWTLTRSSSSSFSAGLVDLLLLFFFLFFFLLWLFCWSSSLFWVVRPAQHTATTCQPSVSHTRPQTHKISLSTLCAEEDAHKSLLPFRFQSSDLLCLQSCLHSSCELRVSESVQSVEFLGAPCLRVLASQSSQSDQEEDGSPERRKRGGGGGPPPLVVSVLHVGAGRLPAQRAAVVGALVCCA